MRLTKLANWAIQISYDFFIHAVQFKYIHGPLQQNCFFKFLGQMVRHEKITFYLLFFFCTITSFALLSHFYWWHADLFAVFYSSRPLFVVCKCCSTHVFSTFFHSPQFGAARKNRCIFKHCFLRSFSLQIGVAQKTHAFNQFCFQTNTYKTYVFISVNRCCVFKTHSVKVPTDASSMLFIPNF